MKQVNEEPAGFVPDQADEIKEKAVPSKKQGDSKEPDESQTIIPYKTEKETPVIIEKDKPEPLIKNTNTPFELSVLRGHKDWVWTVAFAPDGKILASGSQDKTIRLWDIKTGKELSVLRVQESMAGEILTVAFSPDGKHLASGSLDKTVRLWRIFPGKHIHYKA